MGRDTWAPLFKQRICWEAEVRNDVIKLIRLVGRESDCKFSTQLSPRCEFWLHYLTDNLKAHIFILKAQNFTLGFKVMLNTMLLMVVWCNLMQYYIALEFYHLLKYTHQPRQDFGVCINMWNYWWAFAKYSSAHSRCVTYLWFSLKSFINRGLEEDGLCEREVWWFEKSSLHVLRCYRLCLIRRL